MEGKDFVSSLRPNGANHTPPPIFKKRSGSFKWIALVVIGLLLMFIGSVWVSMSMWTPPPKPTEYPNHPDYVKAINNWANSTRTGNLYGRIVMESGAMIMIIAGVFGFADSSVDADERKIFFAMAMISLILLVIISVGLFVSSPYLSS